MHQDREHNHQGSVISMLGHQARRALTSAREGWNDEETWSCAFCGTETSEKQFWCSHCSRCRCDGEVLSPQEIGLHWEQHFPTGPVAMDEEAEGRRSSDARDAHTSHDDR